MNSESSWLRQRVVGAAFSLGLSLMLVGCGPGRARPKHAQKKFSALDRIEQVGRVWEETTQTEAFLSDKQVAFARVRDKFRLVLGARRRLALVELERSELFRTRDGREYHCRVEGAVQVGMSHAMRVGEPTLSLRVPAVSFARTCRESGFARRNKTFPARNVTYALRGDRLVAIEPITLRSALLPMD